MGGSVGKVDTPEGVGRLENFGKRLLSQTRPSRELLMGQLEDVLAGGSGARIPIIGRAVAASEQATNQALRGTDESLGLTGLRGTVFGDRIMGRTRQAGAQHASQVPARYLSAFLESAPGVIAGFQGQGMEALTAGSNLRLQQEMFNDQQTRAFFQDLKSSLQSGGSMAKGMG